MNDTALMAMLQANGIREKDAALLIAASHNCQMGIGEVISAMIYHGDNRAWLKEQAGAK